MAISCSNLLFFFVLDCLGGTETASSAALLERISSCGRISFSSELFVDVASMLVLTFLLSDSPACVWEVTILSRLS